MNENFFPLWDAEILHFTLTNSQIISIKVVLLELSVKHSFTQAYAHGWTEVEILG